MFQALPPPLWNTQQFAVILLSFIYSDYKAPVLRDVGQRASTTPTRNRFLEIRAQDYNPADFQNTNRNNSVQITQLGTVFNIAVAPSSTLTFSPHLVFPEPLFPGGGCSPGTTSPGLSWLLACFHGHFPAKSSTRLPLLEIVLCTFYPWTYFKSHASELRSKFVLQVKKSIIWCLFRER